MSSVEVTQAHLDRITAVDASVHAFLHVCREEALAVAADVDAQRAAGTKLHPLAGVPVAVKDVVVTKGIPSTAGSRILQGWVPPYDATLVERLKAAGMPILGKTNMDEFAMGSSTEHSAYGDTHNPWDLDRIPGGSGGGSAAAVAAYEAPLAIGTDTGGSIRQPAAVTGTVGTKPHVRRGLPLRTHRHGVESRPGGPGHPHRARRRTAARGDRRARPPRLHLAGRAAPRPGRRRPARRGWRPHRGAHRRRARAERRGVPAGVRARFDEALDLLRGAGAEVVEVGCPSFTYALAAYYLIMPSEASSNLARFDGMRFGLRVEPSDGPVTAERVMGATRGAGFGDEVKRRIILGTYALSAGYYDAYYGSAQKVRTLIQRDFAAAFERADVLVSPTAPTTAFKLGEKLDDPMAMYLNDVATIPANLAGVPGISRRRAASDDGLPGRASRCSPRPAPTTGSTGSAPRSRRSSSGVGRPAAGPGPELEVTA